MCVSRVTSMGYVGDVIFLCKADYVNKFASLLLLKVGQVPGIQEFQQEDIGCYRSVWSWYGY